MKSETIRFNEKYQGAIMERGHMTIECDDDGTYLLNSRDEYGPGSNALFVGLSRGDMIRLRNAINKILDN